MSTEELNRILKEVNQLTPQERRELIDRLAHEEQDSQEQIVPKGAVKYIAADVDDSAPSNLSTHDKEITAVTATLRQWVNDARNLRAELPLTSDSVDLLRELREVRSRQ